MSLAKNDSLWLRESSPSPNRRIPPTTAALSLAHQAPRTTSASLKCSIRLDRPIRSDSSHSPGRLSLAPRRSIHTSQWSIADRPNSRRRTGWAFPAHRFRAFRHNRSTNQRQNSPTGKPIRTVHIPPRACHRRTGQKSCHIRRWHRHKSRRPCGCHSRRYHRSSSSLSQHIREPHCNPHPWVARSRYRPPCPVHTRAPTRHIALQQTSVCSSSRRPNKPVRPSTAHNRWERSRIP